MISQLNLERETTIMNLAKEMKIDIEKSKEINDSFTIEHKNEISEITDELIKKLIDLLNN